MIMSYKGCVNELTKLQHETKVGKRSGDKEREKMTLSTHPSGTGTFF